MDKYRCGKIARLPKDIRLQLNQHLADNISSRHILAWLNALPAVHQLLTAHFAGQPITKQNLSVWKQGGYRDWERSQEVRRRLRTSLEEAGEIRAEVKDSDTVSG